MKTWLSAWHLAKYELQAFHVQLLSCWFFLSVLGLLFLTNFNTYMAGNYVMFDGMFIFLFSFGPYFFKVRHFEYKKGLHQVWASPILHLQLQLPIPLNILARSQLLVYLGYFIPFYLFTFVMMYMMSSKFNSAFSLPDFLVFMSLWLALSLFIGIILPACDVVNSRTIKTTTIRRIIVVLVMLIPLVLFYRIYHIGFVAWTMGVVITAPLLAMLFSIVVLIGMTLFGPYYMKKIIQKSDYM